MIVLVDGETDKTQESDEDNDSAEDDESTVLRDEGNSAIYVRRVLKSNKKMTKQTKKGDRVYNSYHTCFYCDKLVQHVRQHLKKKHKSVQEVVEAIESKNGEELSKLRAKGDDKHNTNVIKDGKGEILLLRRPVKTFRISDYGPCPHCREWIKSTMIKRHQPKCIAAHNAASAVQSKRMLQIQSDVMCGRFKSTASDLLRDEVFSIMICDEITRIAQGDPLIAALGESWLRRNRDNRATRKYYSSQAMRLNARFLIELRKESGTGGEETSVEVCENTMWDYLKPQHFDHCARAAIRVALPYMDDEEDLRAPSNSIKLKYDIKQLVNMKWSFIMKKAGSPEVAKECKNFLQLLQMEWGERVTKLARTILMERQFTKVNEIPSPEDVKTLCEHVSSKMKTLELKKDKLAYASVVELVQTRLLCYNKRRSGEMDAIRLKDYAGLRKELSDVDESLIGELSPLERHLFKSQDLLIVRGKRGKPVPVLVPEDTKAPLSWLANADIRREAGIHPKNTFLFPTSGLGPKRCYESMSKLCNSLNLRAPERITSVALRKYTATLSQVINLENNQLQWLCKHLGHTKRVHLEHYRQMSGFIERVEIGKLLLVQDLNLTEKFKGRKLNDIGWSDIVFSQAKEDAGVQDHTETEVQGSTQNKANEHQEMGASTEDENEEESTPPKRRKTKDTANRLRWTEKEQEEISRYLNEYLLKKITPGKAACLKAIKESRNNEGELFRRTWPLIVKKVSALNRK